jgi:hypothetical protein
MEIAPPAEGNVHPANGERHEIAPGVPLDDGNPDGPAKAARAVDLLAAWGRGEREVLFTEVQQNIDHYALIEIQKMVDARFGGIVDRRAAIQFLVAEGIIAADEARTDV